MRSSSSAPSRQGRVIAILTGFTFAVVASAAGGWWYARESTPHHGPIVLISVDGLRPADLEAYGGEGGRVPGIDALSAEAVVFERAYAHSPLTLPAHASILAGQLPFEHGVRDEAGFTLKEEARSMPELLRSRGFDTGAAVSSFLLRPESGVAQGFAFFDAKTADASGALPVLQRAGVETADAAERWLRSRRGQRFMLFVQVDQNSADSVVTRLVTQLKQLDLYDRATIVLTADRGDAGSGFSLDEAALRVPLLVKQPDGQGAGRRIAGPVQHIDLLPTVLDLVRAPIPSGLRGRSLRAVLDGGEDVGGDSPIYAETLAAQVRFGGPGKFSLVTPMYRYIRGGRDEVIDLDSGEVSSPEETPEADALRTELEDLIEQQQEQAVVQRDITPAEEDLFASMGYLGGGQLFDPQPEPLEPDQEAWVVETHRMAATLAGHKDYSGAIAHLRRIADAYPRMAVVQYQLGTLLGRLGRIDEAKRAFGAAAAVEPDNPHVAIVLSGMLLRADQPEVAREQAALAVALAEHADAPARAAAHQVAARVAMALEDYEAAAEHAELAHRDDPTVALVPYVRARSLAATGRHEEALVAFDEAAEQASGSEMPLEDLQLHRGETLARLERFDEAEEGYRAEMRAYPRNPAAYASLATLYHASNRETDAAALLDVLIESVPTPEGYETAARLWTVLGQPARAAAVRADARSRFRTSPLAGRIAQGGPRQ